MTKLVHSVRRQRCAHSTPSPVAHSDAARQCTGGFVRQLSSWRLLALAVIGAAFVQSPAPAAEAPVEPVHFIVVDYHERYLIQLTEPAKIEAARKMMVGAIPTPGWVLGRLAEGDGGYNRDPGSGRRWTWHLVPDSIEFSEVTAEALQTLPSGIEDDKPYWLETMKWAAIGGRIESEGLEFQPAQFVNQSARSWIGTGDDVQITGFVVAGAGRKTVLVRAAGPALAPLGVPAPLADPVLELRRPGSGELVAANDNWSADPAGATLLETAAARVGAFPWTRGSADAALLATLEPGAYTAIVRGAGSGTGVGLTEIYLADTLTRTRLVNVSARARVGASEKAVIAGFAISRAERKRLLIRAAGPALAAQGVTDALANPVLTVYDQNTAEPVASNDNWEVPADDSDVTREDIEQAVARVGAAPFARGSADAAVLIELDPGLYTAVVTGAANTAGVTLVEVFEVPESTAAK